MTVHRSCFNALWFSFFLYNTVRYIVIPVLSIILFFPAGALLSSIVGDDWGSGIAAVGMYLVFPIIMFSLWPTRAKQYPESDSMEEALAAGQLGVCEFSADAAVEIVAQGPAKTGHLFVKRYFLAVGPQETLFLSGLYLYELVKEGVFPSTRFRIYWHRTQDFTYGIECLGSPLEPLACRHAYVNEENMLSSAMPADRELLQKSLDDLFGDEPGIFQPESASET